MREFSLSGAGIDAQLSAIIDPTGDEIVITPDLSVVVNGLSRFATLAGGDLRCCDATNGGLSTHFVPNLEVDEEVDCQEAECEEMPQ